MGRKNSWLIWGFAALLVWTPLASQEWQQSRAAEEGSEDTLDQVEDVIVVTASRTEQSLHEVPAAISVLDAETLEKIPSDNYGDILRNVPGLNVSQMSARDINVSGRQATASLANTQLACVAELMDCPVLCLVDGADPDPSLLEAAARGQTAVVVSGLDMFETCGRLHRRLYGDRFRRS